MDKTMNVKRLLESLDGISAIVGAAGAKKAADGLRALKGLFVGDVNSPAADAVDEIQKLLDTAKAAERDAYVEQLVAAGTDKSKFSAAYLVLQDDKRMGKEDVSAIAHRFTDGRKKWGSRKAAL